jgi:hypothetical protein
MSGCGNRKEYAYRSRFVDRLCVVKQGTRKHVRKQVSICDKEKFTPRSRARAVIGRVWQTASNDLALKQRGHAKRKKEEEEKQTVQLLHRDQLQPFLLFFPLVLSYNVDGVTLRSCRHHGIDIVGVKQRLLHELACAIRRRAKRMAA